MSIVVTVIEFPQGTSLAKSSMTFDEQGGTMGRTQSNTWVLDDPERFLSGSHCRIENEGGSYYLVDTSTNGTFVNNASEPLGKGNKVQLNTGDQFELSEYKFKVEILSGGQANLGLGGFDNAPSNLDIDDPFGSPSFQPEPIPADPFAQPVAPTPTQVIPVDLPIDTSLEETDPLAALDKSTQPFETTEKEIELFSNSYADNAGAVEQAVAWPSAAPQKGLIPEDWDDDSLEPEPEPKREPEPEPIAPQPEVPKARPQATPEPAAPSISVSESEARRRALEQANRKLKAEVVNLRKQLKNTKPRKSVNVDTRLIDAIGFKERDLSEDKIAEINEVSGELLRRVVEGMMQTLSSRNDIKNTFRMNMTTIQPVENNPLKFSANVDDALENMFIKEGNSYKKPLEAVQECFESIADHQVAILAGIRSAFKSIVHRFEPGVLETRFEKQNKKSLISLNEKAKHWDAFNDYYSEMFGDLDRSFQYLFGDEFTQAYEEQLQKLSFARKEQEKLSKLGNK